MVTVSVRRHPDGRIVAFRAEGHSGMAPKGSDIACAAVSALTQAAALGLLQHVRIPVELEEGDGLLALRLPTSLDPTSSLKAQAVLDTMVLGLKEVAAQFPQSVRVVEVTG